MRLKRLYLSNKVFLLVLIQFCMFLKLQPTIRAEGIAGAATLKIVPSARASAMGDTFTGVADDVNTIFFNPAGLSLLQRPSVSFIESMFFC